MNIEIAKSIDGFMSDNELEWLARQAFKSKIIYECGCYLGRSTRAMADNMRNGGKLFAVDPWYGPYYDDDNKSIVLEMTDHHYFGFLQNLQEFVMSERVVPIRKKFSDTKLRADTDFIFIDGDHHYDTVLIDINHALGVAPKIIAGHDYGRSDWPGVKRAVDEIFGARFINCVAESIWWTSL